MSCLGKPPLCTDLLDHPASVLGDKGLWPEHLCHESFLMESTQRWARRTAMFRDGGRSVRRWREYWPLPVGVRAVEAMISHSGDQFASNGSFDLDYRGPDYGALLNLVPFEEDEEALWALRVETGNAALDLFGLADSGASRQATSSHQGKSDMFTPGELKYMLRGVDKSLIDILDSAQRWWSSFSAQTVLGRPRNSGTWASAQEFEDALRKAVRNLRSQGRKATQESVAELLSSNDRVLRRWLNRYHIKWIDVLMRYR